MITDRDVLTVMFIALIFVFAIGYTVFSATTISTNISTDGTLSVSGASTVAGLTASGALYASSTLQATGDGIFYDQLSAGASTNSPTTTFNVTGSGYFTGGLGIGFATTGAGQLHVTGASVFESDATFNGRVVGTNSGVSSFAGTLGVASTTPTTTVGVVGSGYFTGGIGVGFATTGAGQIHNTGLTVHESRLGANGTTSPYQSFGVSGSGAFADSGTSTISAESTANTSGGCIELKSSGSAVDTRWIRIYVGSTGATTTATGAVIQANARGLLIVEEGSCQ